MKDRGAFKLFMREIKQLDLFQRKIESIKVEQSHSSRPFGRPKIEWIREIRYRLLLTVKKVG